MKRLLTITTILLILVILTQTNKAATATAAGGIPDCTAAQHNQSGTTIAPDGNAYRTWMPQVDSRYGCHHQHEHGTNPAVLFQSGWRPPFGYAATVANGQPMFHEGYKGIGFYSGEYVWYITIHQGSSEPGALCIRHHDLGVYVEHAATGERMAEIYYMADFGYSRRNVDGAQFTPSTCPNQADGVPNNGARLFGVTNDTIGLVNYNPWRVAQGQNAAGFNAAHFTIWVDSIKLPSDLNVSSFDPNPYSHGGAARLVAILPEIGFVNPPTTGDFCTDAYATAVIGCEEPGAIRQYVNPAVTDLRPSITNVTLCHQRDPHSQLYICGNNAYDPWAWGNYDLFGGIGDKN